MTEIIVIGREEVEAKLQGLNDGLIGGFTIEAMQTGLNEAVEEIQSRVPRDTDELHDSIAGLVDEDASPLRGILQATAEHGPFQEFGTRRHFVPEKYIGGWAARHGFGRTGLIVSGKAQPFFRRNASESLRQVGERVKERILEVLEDLVEEYLR